MSDEDLRRLVHKMQQDNAAALAWAKLTPEQQARILADAGVPG